MTQKQMSKLEDQTQRQANFHAVKNISGFSSSKIQEQEQTAEASESWLPGVYGDKTEQTKYIEKALF